MLCCQIHRAEPITQNNWALTRIPYYIRPFGLDEAHNNTLHKPSLYFTGLRLLRTSSEDQLSFGFAMHFCRSVSSILTHFQFPTSC